jgi:hypothetical protein
MRLPRFRLRTLMVAVAVVALVSGGWSMWSRSDRFTRIGWSHQARKNSLAANPPRVGDADRGREGWHAAMAAKYFRAARSPWLPVEPDPSPP